MAGRWHPEPMPLPAWGEGGRLSMKTRLHYKCQRTQREHGRERNTALYRDSPSPCPRWIYTPWASAFEPPGDGLHTVIIWKARLLVKWTWQRHLLPAYSLTGKGRSCGLRPGFNCTNSTRLSSMVSFYFWPMILIFSL